MTTELMPPPAKAQSSTSSEPTISEIIAAARNAPAGSRGVWCLSGLTACLHWASFPPLDWGPLGWVSLVPLILLIRLKQRTRWMYVASYCGGLAFTLATLQWMRLGDTWMYPAWVMLSVYMALYFPVFVAASRIAVHRFHVPLMLAVPVVWVGLEYVRATLMTGFGWYNISHTQYRWVELIQISDLVGAYGVSFVMLTMAACIAGLFPASLFARLKLLPAQSTPESQVPAPPLRRQIVQVVMGLTLVAATLGYGYIRRAQADFQEGPRVALIQGNFPASLKHRPDERGEIYLRHDFLTGQAVPHQPDLVVWPETMFRWPLRVVPPQVSGEDLAQIVPNALDGQQDERVQAWHDPTVRQMLERDSQKAGAAMIVGADTLVAEPSDIKRYNSAVFIRPDMGLRGRYDKIHRVIFGEYIPLREEFPWLARLTPFGENFGIDAGESAALFEYRGWKFTPIICYEDTVPHLVRRILKSTAVKNDGQTVDCLINLTNDGWFHGSSELDQHLITAAFRCVEYRVPMTRAVNTGISAVIDGDGVIVEPDVFLDANQQGRNSMRDPETGRWHRQLDAVLVDSIPLDNRNSLYLIWGDWFAGTCTFLTVLVVLWNLIPRSREEKSQSKQPS